MREILRSKIHRATVTHADLNYTGSITIDEDLIEKAGPMPGEKVLVVDITNGTRLETYVMVGEKGSNIISVNGPAAHLIKVGDMVSILGFELINDHITPKKILVDKNNIFIKYIE